MRMTLRHEPARRFSVNTPALLESDIRILDNLAPLQSFITKKIAELLGRAQYDFSTLLCDLRSGDGILRRAYKSAMHRLDHGGRHARGSEQPIPRVGFKSGKTRFGDGG